MLLAALDRKSTDSTQLHICNISPPYPTSSNNKQDTGHKTKAEIITTKKTKS